MLPMFKFGIQYYFRCVRPHKSYMQIGYKDLLGTHAVDQQMAYVREHQANLCHLWMAGKMD